MFKESFPKFYDSHLTWKDLFISKKLITYFLYSTGFWFLVVLYTLIKNYDAHIGSSLMINKIDSYIFLFYVFFYSFCILSICAVIGFFLSIPALLVRFCLKFFLHAARKNYKRAFFLDFSTRLFPIVFLALSNGLFYYANLKTSPIDRNETKKLEKIIKNYEKIGTANPSANYIFLLPSHLLNDPNKLKNTKNLFRASGSLLPESYSKTEIVSLLTNTETSNFLAYHAPVYLENEISEKNHYVPKKLLTIGIDRKHQPQFLNLYANNILEYKFFHLTKSTLFTNRIMAALQPVHLFLKANLFGFLSPNWKWNNYSDSSTDVLYLYSSKLKKMHPSQYNIAFLTELEPIKEKSLFLSLSDFFDTQDTNKYEKILDTNLFNIVRILKEKNANNVYLIPYTSHTKDLEVSKYYSFNTDSLKSYRTFFRTFTDQLVCKTRYTQSRSNLDTLNTNFLYNNIKFTKTGKPFLDKTNAVYFQRFFSSDLVCYENGNTIYYVQNPNLVDNAFLSLGNPEINLLSIKKIDNQNKLIELTQNEKTAFIDRYTYEISK